jgi:hypothetical protein
MINSKVNPIDDLESLNEDEDISLIKKKNLLVKPNNTIIVNDDDDDDDDDNVIAPINEEVSVKNIALTKVQLKRSRTISFYQTKNIKEIGEAIQSETLYISVYRYLGRISGIISPLCVLDYNSALKKYGSNDNIRREYVTDVMLSGHGIVLHSDVLPFDLYTLIKDCHILFCLLILVSFLSVLNITIGTLSCSNECLDIDEYCTSTYAVYITGFLIISGLRSFDVNNTACMTILSSAIFIGIYITLPIIGSVFLVRLLATGYNSLRVSNFILLTKRKGRPTVIIRAMNSSGIPCSNFTAEIGIVVLKQDDETGESYGETQFIPMNYPNTLGFATQDIIATIEDDHILMKDEVIKIDKDGIARWNHSCIGYITIRMTADAEWGGRNMQLMLNLFDSRYHLVEANERGEYPVFISSIISTVYDWRVTKGEKTPMSDLSLLSKWKYAPNKPTNG